MIGSAAKLRETDMPPMTARAIADMLRDEILAGTHPPGSQLPTYGEIAARAGGVSNSTVQRAMGRLETLRLVEYRPGRGWYVTDRRG